MNIVKIPLEYFHVFHQEPERATLEYLSIPMGSVSPFFRNAERVQAAMDKGMNIRNPLDEDTYLFASDFKAHDEVPRYMHIDLAINRDGVGISMCHAEGFDTRMISVPGKPEPQEVQLVRAAFDFLGILRPRLEFGERDMDYTAIEEMIQELAFVRGFNLQDGLITFDRFQSHQLMTSIRSMGIPCGLLSIDRTTSKIIVDFTKEGFVRRESIQREPSAAMGVLRDGLYREAVKFCQIPMFDEYRNWLEKEIDECQWDASSQKAVKMEGGSDDLLQSVAGSIYNCANNAHEHSVPVDTPSADSIRQEDEFYQSVNRGDTWWEAPASDDEFIEDSFSIYDDPMYWTGDVR